MLSELVAALPYYVMGIGSSLTVLLRSCSLKISCWKFLAIMWGKTIIVNILILAVIKHYYGNTMAFRDLGNKYFFDMVFSSYCVALLGISGINH